MVVWVSYKTKELIGSAIGTKYLRMGPVKFVENSLQKLGGWFKIGGGKFICWPSNQRYNFSKLKNLNQVKCSPVIQFKEFSKIDKIELHDVIWKYLPQYY